MSDARSRTKSGVLLAAALAAALPGCALPEETRRALRIRSSLGEEVDPAEFEDLLSFALDRHVRGAEPDSGRALREGLWLVLEGLDPSDLAVSPPDRARLIAHAGESPRACAEAVGMARDAWNAAWPARALSYSEVAERALQCIFPRFDPHSAWFPRSTWGDMARSMSGRYTGIGIVIQPGDEPVVSDVFEGGPADGILRRKDRIVAVDGKAVKGLTAEEYLALIRGESGTDVRISVKRGEESIELTLTRREVKARAVRRREAGRDRDVVVLGLWSYTDGCADEMEDALRRKGRAPRGLVLDLRNNPGGTVDDAVAIVDLFIHKGVVITERGRSTRVLEADVEGTVLPPAVPVIVLLNRFSASASELTAGALQDHGRAVIMGEATYGKGTVQEIYKLGDRGAKVTVARFYLPAGRSTQLAGVSPDIAYPDAEAAKLQDAGLETFERDYDNALPADAVAGGFKRAYDPAPLVARLRGRLGAESKTDPEIDETDAMLQEAVRILDGEGREGE
ncbi:MAG: S41 family peptidase [Planctomycetota bacterium]